MTELIELLLVFHPVAIRNPRSANLRPRHSTSYEREVRVDPNLWAPLRGFRFARGVDANAPLL